MCGMWRMFSLLYLPKATRIRGLSAAGVRGGRCISESEMVGTTGFEPATSRTPSVRATRLRYVPTGTLTATGQRNQKAESGEGISTSKVSPPFEQRQESAQRIAQIQQHLAAQKLPLVFGRVLRPRILRLEFSFMLTQKAARPRDGKSLVIEQPLDAEDHVHVVLAVEAMAAGALDRLQHGEFAFPVTQNERFQRRQAADFADAVEFFLRGDLRCCGVA